MSENEGLLSELNNRIRQLESRVDALRISRRVLLSLMEVMEKEKKEQLNNLVSRNKKLEKVNSRYAKAILCRDSKIIELEKQLRTVAAGKNRPENTFT